MPYDSTGAGSRPTLGRSKPVGLARPGGISGVHSASTDVPKAARPGKPGGQFKPPAAGPPPKVARPGDKGSIGGGGGTPKGSPDW